MEFEKFMEWVYKEAVRMGIPAVPESTGKFLSFLTFIESRNKKSLNIVELGAGIGYSVLWMFYGILKAGAKGRIYGVERKKENFERAIEILEEGEKKLKIEFKNSIIFNLKEAEDLKGDEFGKIDLFFLDIHKEGYYSLLLKFEKNIKKNGIVVAHNVFSHREELKDFIKKIENKEEYITFFLETDPAGISVSYKRI